MAAAALLLALAVSARADVAVYDAGRDPGKGVIFSADGYHYAFFENAGGEDRWIVDGKVRAKGPGGLLSGPGALNANGALLLHSIAVLDKAGDIIGYAAAVDGRRIGTGVFAEIQSPALSPRGTNSAYVGRTEKGWVVASQQGTGPAFEEPPLHLSITEKQTLYVVNYGGAAWLYRDHKPATRTAFSAASSSRDLRHVGGVYTGSDDMIYVSIDEFSFGPYNSASAPVFSPDGTHSAFLAGVRSQSGYDALFVDGKPTGMKRCGDCTVAVDDRGRAFQDVVMTGASERLQIHMAFLDGKSVHPGGQPPRVGLAPGGGHYVYPMLSPQGVAVGLDGKISEKGVPMPLVPGPVAFDGEEYHYWSTKPGRLLLVCGSAAGPRAPKSRCAGTARSLGWPQTEAVEEPPAR